MSKNALTALVAVGLLSMTAACGTASSATTSSGPVKIGLVAPLTGPFAPLGLGDKAAVEQEVARINAHGGVLGRKLVVTIKDDKTDVPQSVTDFNQLAADKSYTAILSSSNVSASTAAGPSMQSNRIPTIALGPVSAFKDGKNKYAFTCVAIPELYGEALVDYLKAQGLTKVAIAYTGKDPYGSVGNKATVDAAKAAGLDVVLDKEIDVAGTDFTPVISQVKAAKPDAFVVWVAGPASVIITKQFAGSGIPLMMTGAEASNLYVQPAGQEGEGVTMTSNIAVPGRELPAGPLKESIDAFANPWLQANKGVYPPQFAFDGATGIQLLVAAIEKAKSTDREKVRDALESLDLLTPTGRFQFSPTDHGGIGKDAIAIVQVKGGDLKATPYSLEQFKTNLPD
jgi:branched-chain amino acid transport system substrate-binding protein